MSMFGKCDAFLIIGLLVLLTGPVAGISVSGAITSNNVNATGSINFSSVTVSSTSINDLLIAENARLGIKGLVLQTIISSAAASDSTSSISLTPISNLNITAALSNIANYFKISLSGVLSTSEYTARANLSIERDSTDLGQGSFTSAYGYPGSVFTGVVITDSPGDISTHTYRATFSISQSTQTAHFSGSPVAYMILEEIAR